MRKTKPAPRKPRKTQEKRPICFVIMPYGEWFDDYYSSIFVPAIESARLEPHRADDLFRPSAIVNDIWAYTRSAKVVLADLTGQNPNVFYELGLAHAIAKPAVLVTESMDDVPFDLRGLRIIEYDKNAPNWGQLLTASIESALKETLTSPAETVLPTFLTKALAQTGARLSGEARLLLSLRQDIDMLKREIRNVSMEPRMPRPPRLNPNAVFETRTDTLSPSALKLIRYAVAQGRDISDEYILRLATAMRVPDELVRHEVSRLKASRHEEGGRLVVDPASPASSAS